MKFLALLLALFLIFTNILLIAHFEPLYWVFQKGNQRQALHQTLSFFRGESGLPTGFSEEETSHLNDVKIVLGWITGIWIFSGLVAMGFIHKVNKKEISNRAGIKLIMLAIFGFFLAIGFNKLFELFHKVVFPKGNWTFDINSPIITMFPFGFFIAAYLSIMALSLLEGLILIFLAKKF